MSNSTVNNNLEAAIKDRAIRLADYRRRIVKAVSDISMASPSAMRGYLDSYARHVTPAMANNADTMFPTTLKLHPRNRDKTQHEARNANLLSYVGITVAAYYAAVLDDKTDLPSLLKRVVLLEGVAKDGLGQYRVTGDVGNGFTLEKTPDPRKEEK